MTLEELLNSEMDVASLVALGRQGLTWWLDELGSMLPAAWRDRLSSRPRVWVEPHNEAWRFWRDGRPLADGAPPPPKQTPIGLLAPPGAVLVRQTPAPRLPTADIRRIMVLDIDRLSPLAPHLVHFDMEVLDRDGGDGRARVLIGVIPRQAAAGLVREARSAGFAPTALAARSPVDGAQPIFDFLPATLAAEGVQENHRIRTYAWIAVAALILLNLVVLVGRDIIEVSRLREAVDGQRPAVEAVTRLRRRVESEDARRRALLAEGRRGEPLRVLNALSTALPESAWVQRLEWNGQTLRISGFSRPDVDLAAAIRGTGAFTNPRLLPSGPVTSPTLPHPFDVTADARAERRP